MLIIFSQIQKSFVMVILSCAVKPKNYVWYSYSKKKKIIDNFFFLIKLKNININKNNF